MLLTLPVICIIDDDNDDSEMLSQFFSTDLEYLIFTTGEKAIQTLRESGSSIRTPSLIILDFNMPGNNGLEILRDLKKETRTRDIPVVMYSTSLTNSMQNMLLANGAYACFIKPCSIHQIKIHAKVFANLALNFSCVNKLKTKPEFVLAAKPNNKSNLLQNQY